MKNIIKIALFLAFLSQIAFAKHNHYEKHYQSIHCNNIQGETEVSIDGGRIDCLTGKYAIEHDFNGKVFECIGQALFYAEYTHKIPVCALIFENGDSEAKAVRIFETATRNIANIILVKLYQDGSDIHCKSEVKDLC